MSRAALFFTTAIAVSVLFVFLIAGFVASAVVEQSLRDRLHQSLTQQLEETRGALARSALTGANDITALLVERPSLLAGTLSAYDSNGNLIADGAGGILPTNTPSDIHPSVSAALEQSASSQTKFFSVLHPDTMTIVLRLDEPDIRGVVYLAASAPLEQIESALRPLHTTFLILCVVFLALSVPTGMFAARRLGDPLRPLSEILDKIRGGNRDLRFPVSSTDGTKDFASSFNALMDQSIDEVQQLRKLETMRSEFLGNVSHELRTPIFSLQGFLETLLDGAVDDPAVNRSFIEKALRQAQRLNNLLSDLIEISRIETREMKMIFRPFNLAELLEQVVRDFQSTADDARVSLSLSVPHQAVQAIGDKDRLRQVLANLVQNAIKYNKPGGTVVVAVSNAGERVSVSVEDTGMGIPKEHLARIFERFYRVDKDRSREVGGTGLGLAIVKHIVDAHGSKVEVESAVGKGSVFRFTLRR